MRLEFSKEEKFEKISYKNHIIKKYLQKFRNFFLQNLEKLVKFASKICKQKLQAKMANKNCKQKLQAKIASKNCK